MPVVLYVLSKCLLVASVLVFVMSSPHRFRFVCLYVLFGIHMYSVEPLLYFHVFCLILSSSAHIHFGMCGARIVAHVNTNFWMNYYFLCIGEHTHQPAFTNQTQWLKIRRLVFFILPIFTWAESFPFLVSLWLDESGKSNTLW